MSIRAWLARRQIKKAFRGDLLGKEPAGSVIEFDEALSALESQLPKPPKRAVVEPVDTEHNGKRVRGEWVQEPGTRTDRILFYSHGGGYVWGAPKFYRDLGWRLSKACDARVFLLDYTLAPEAQCPTQIEEGLAAYDMIREAHPDANYGMAGDSAGGGLTAALAVAIRDSGRAAADALSLISPWLDQTGSGDSMKYNGDKDVMLRPAGITAVAAQYHGDLPADDPRCSPLFADHAGLPPTLVQVGSEEILLDDSTRFEASMKKAGGDVTLRIWPKMHHVWHMSAGLVPEGKKAIREMAAHFDRYWA